MDVSSQMFKLLEMFLPLVKLITSLSNDHDLVALTSSL